MAGCLTEVCEQQFAEPLQLARLQIPGADPDLYRASVAGTATDYRDPPRPFARFRIPAPFQEQPTPATRVGQAKPPPNNAFPMARARPRQHPTRVQHRARGRDQKVKVWTLATAHAQTQHQGALRPPSPDAPRAAAHARADPGRRAPVDLHPSHTSQPSELEHS